MSRNWLPDERECPVCSQQYTAHKTNVPLDAQTEVFDTSYCISPNDDTCNLYNHP